MRARPVLHPAPALLPTLLLSLLLAIGPQRQAGAASLQVAPTSIVIDARRGAEGLLLQNSGNAPLPVQIRVFRWWQDDGEDRLEPSDALAVSPPMLTIPPGSEQLVRIVHAGDPPAPGREATYRVVVDELPIEDDGAPPRAGLRFAMRYSIPVFVVADPDKRGNPRLSARIVSAAGVAAIEVRNSGDTIAQLVDLAHVDPSGTRTPIARGLAGYVMPGQQRRWPLPPDIDATAGAMEATLNGEPRARALAPDH